MDSDTSLMYRMLPQLIQRRVPKIPSLQRSLSWSSRASSVSYPSTPLIRPSSSASDQSETPPPSYRSSRRYSRVDLASAVPSSELRERLVSISYGHQDGGADAGDGTGIDWKYADQGAYE